MKNEYKKFSEEMPRRGARIMVRGEGRPGPIGEFYTDRCGNLTVCSSNGKHIRFVRLDNMWRYF